MDRDCEWVRSSYILKHTHTHIRHRAGCAGSVLRAWTETVTVRRLKVNKSWDLHVPIVIEGLDEREVCMMFHQIALDLVSKCIDISLRLDRLARQVLLLHPVESCLSAPCLRACFVSAIGLLF